MVVARSEALVPVVVPRRASMGSQKGVPNAEVLRGEIGARCSSSQRCSVSVRQISPRPYLAIKLMASGVTFSAAIVRSPSFSRSSSSTRTIMRPWQISATASSTVANGICGSGIVAASAAEKVVEKGAQRGGARDGEDPGPHDATRDSPAHRREPPRRAHAHNRSGDRVRRADRDAEVRRTDQRQRPCRFRGETAEGVQFGDALPHGLHHAPSAGHRAAGHGQMTANDNPKWRRLAFHHASGYNFGCEDADAYKRMVIITAQLVRGGRDELK